MSSSNVFDHYLTVNCRSSPLAQTGVPLPSASANKARTLSELTVGTYKTASLSPHFNEPTLSFPDEPTLTWSSATLLTLSLYQTAIVPPAR